MAEAAEAAEAVEAVAEATARARGPARPTGPTAPKVAEVEVVLPVAVAAGRWSGASARARWRASGMYEVRNEALFFLFEFFIKVTGVRWLGCAS